MMSLPVWGLVVAAPEQTAQGSGGTNAGISLIHLQADILGDAGGLGTVIQLGNHMES